ncbi:MAG: SoxR reducing system RseC family protein [Bacillota bacterium]|nr:SoxR reducing system RseC family protein [Bacillota bacterium]
MEQYGLILENKEKTALVSLQRHLVCENCGRCGILSGANKKEMIVEALNPIDAEKGQRVMMESNDRQILFLSFMLYLVPLGGLVAGIFVWLGLANLIGLEGSQDLFAVAAGLLLMVIVFVVIRSWDRRVKDDPRYKPVITEIIEEDPFCTPNE